jgi:hypothetical protein
MKNNIQVLNHYIQFYIEQSMADNVLFVNMAVPSLVNLINDNYRTINSRDQLENIDSKVYDIIIIDLPFDPRIVTSSINPELRIRENWDLVQKLFSRIKDTAKALIVFEPNITVSAIGRRFLDDLASRGIFNTAVYQLPDNLYLPQSSIRPLLLEFQRKNADKLFVGDISALEPIHNRDSSYYRNLETGIFLNRNDFKSFDNLRFNLEINNLQTQYHTYNKYSLGEISLDINTTRDHFEDIDNCIYVLKAGTPKVVSKISSLTSKHQNVFQVKLNPSLVKAGYLASFFNTDLGIRILKSQQSGNFVPNLTRDNLLDCLIPLPSVSEQELIINTESKLFDLQLTIDNIKTELSLNPKNVTIILDKVESVMEPLKLMSIEDQILSGIRKGESKTMEFKETFSKNIRTGQKDKEVEKASLKTIVGFLNTNGGTLLIGVSDDGEIKGIEGDFYTTSDKYKLNFKNAIHSKIGPEFYSFIDYDLHLVRGNFVLKIECRPASEPCFYDAAEFFVRTNPATDKLEGKKQVEYIKTRFKD